MIDVHSHLLPGIDDGSPTVERSVEALSLMAAHGVTEVVLTPHLRHGDLVRHGQDAVEQRQETFEMLRAAAPTVPRLHLGFEIMLDEIVQPDAFTDRRFALAGARYFLVEFPIRVHPSAAQSVLARMRASEAVPIVAHPERYHECTPDAVRAWRAAGAAMQLDATAFTRRTPHGRRARALLAEGLVDLVAADNHGDRRVLATAQAYLANQGFAEAARLLTQENPGRVVGDAVLAPVPPIRVRGKVLGRVGRWLGGEGRS